jgi:hypothetical protein
MQTDYPSHIQLYKLRSGVDCLDGYEVSYLSQSVHNYPKRIISRLGPRQSHNEIHSNLFPLRLWYFQKWQQSSRWLMLDLDFLIGVANGNIPSNISLYSPLRTISCLEIVVHLIPSG